MENFDYDLRSVQEVRNLARLGKIATDKLANYTEEQIDRILQNMVRVAEENSVCLAQMAVEETGFGKVADKAYKNHMASTMLYNAIKDMKTIGVVREDVVNKIIEVADPVGLVMGIVPSTNPTSTAIYKAMIAMKSRNAIVFSPHPSAAKCTMKATELMYKAALEAGAPENCIACISMPSMAATDELMHAKEVAIIIATGGPGMVKAAYSAGKPALGVGAGNSPAYIERTANVEKAVRNIMASKTFDNGTICASEQSIICEECNRDAVVAEFKRQGAYFMTADETARVCKLLFKNGTAMNAKFVGRSADVVAAAANINIPAGTRVLIGEQGGVGPEYPLSYEKLTTVLAFYTVKDWHEACELSIALLQNGIGHTMSLHTEDRDMVMKFAAKPASRILVNTGGTMGGTGASTGLMPAFTLGCGTWGGSATSENVTPMHLLNMKKVAYGLVDCETLASNDPTFNYGKAQAATVGSACCGTPAPAPVQVAPPPSIGGTCCTGPGAFSPAQYAAMGASLNSGSACCGTAAPTPAPIPASTGCCGGNFIDEGLNQKDLMDLVNQLVNTMKGVN